MGLTNIERMHLLMSTRVSFGSPFQSTRKYQILFQHPRHSMFKGSRNGLIVKVHLAEVDVRPDLGDTVLHLRDGVHQHVMAAPV